MRRDAEVVSVERTLIMDPAYTGSCLVRFWACHLVHARVGKAPGQHYSLSLPPSSPTAMQDIWGYLRGNRLSRRIWPSYEPFVTACERVCLSLTRDRQRIGSIARRTPARINF